MEDMTMRGPLGRLALAAGLIPGNLAKTPIIRVALKTAMQQRQFVIWTYDTPKKIYLIGSKYGLLQEHRWFVEHDISHLSLTYDSRYQYRTMTTNASESFNVILKYPCGLPIQALIITIYYNIIEGEVVICLVVHLEICDTTSISYD
ncbi:hypothetical protein IEQ34_000559 [Dendrobium chrysotoxum]|uniref:Uncharacterized protein n=1 Tax=Dendrobium chrysotoxum TaxID=161865 RepID=A0AAV7HNV9_DENCH|nr:hypothetical protein IEQ34_000559 [Dendrobium chrysotoxum]